MEHQCVIIGFILDHCSSFCVHLDLFICISSCLCSSLSVILSINLSLSLSLRLFFTLSLSLLPILSLRLPFTPSLSHSLRLFSLSVSSLSVSLSHNYQTTSDESGLIIVWMMHNGMWYVPTLSPFSYYHRFLIFHLYSISTSQMIE